MSVEMKNHQRVAYERQKQKLLSYNLDDESVVKKLQKRFSGDVFQGASHSFVHWLKELQTNLLEGNEEDFDLLCRIRNAIKKGCWLSQNAIDHAQKMGLRHWRNACVTGRSFSSMDYVDFRQDDPES